MGNMGSHHNEDSIEEASGEQEGQGGEESFEGSLVNMVCDGDSCSSEDREEEVEEEELEVMWGDDEEDEENGHPAKRHNSRGYCCHVCKGRFLTKAKLFKHYAAAFGHFTGGAYPDHIEHLWSESLTPDLLPSRDDPLYQEIVNFIRNLQYDNRIRRVHDPRSLPVGPKVFVGTNAERAAFEQRIRWKENDPRLEWPKKQVPFCYNGPDAFVISGESLSTGSLPRRGGARGSGPTSSGSGSGSGQSDVVNGAVGQHGDLDYDFEAADPDDRVDDDSDAGGRRARGVLDDAMSKHNQTDNIFRDLRSSHHPSIFLQVSGTCWVAQGYEIQRRDGEQTEMGGVFKQNLEVLTLLQHHKSTSIRGWNCTCESFRANVSSHFTSGQSLTSTEARGVSPTQGQESDNDDTTSVGEKAPCLHVSCVVHESQCGASGGRHHPVHDNVDYFDCEVVPICLFESESVPYACRCMTPGHPPAYMFLVCNSDSGSICQCKVQKDKGKLIVRCISSSRHGSLKSPCCIATRDFFNLKATSITGLASDDVAVAILRAELPAVKHTATPSTFSSESFRRTEGFHPAEPPHSITARKKWYERVSDLVDVNVEYHDSFPQIPKMVTIKRASPTVADGHATEERVRYATVWGQQQAVQVRIIEWCVTSKEGTSYFEDIPGVELGLFRFSVDEYFDAGMLYNFLWMSSAAGQVTMQAFHEKMLKEYHSFRMSEFPKDSSLPWIDFPTNTKFNAVIHCFKSAHEYNQNKFLKNVDVCPRCNSNSSIQIWDGTFRFLLSKYLDNQFSTTFLDQNLDCDPRDHEGGVRRRCLQSRLHQRRTDAEFSLLTCTPSEFYPVGYEQMGMLQSMVFNCAGVSVHPESLDATTVGASADRSRFGGGKHSRRGVAKDSSKSKIPRHEWAGDGDFEKMYEMQAGSNHPFGPELVALCNLFREQSPLAKKGTGVPEVLLLVAHDCSVQAVVTFNMMPILEVVLGEPITIDALDRDSGSHELEEKLKGIRDRLNQDGAKEHLGSFIGNPEIVNVLVSVVDCIPLLSTEKGLIDDCAVVLSFLFYLIDCVKLSVTADSRERILEAARKDPRRPGKLRACPSGCSAPDSCERCSYSEEGFVKYGAHYPGMAVKEERGRYPKDKPKAAEMERKDQEQGCEKDFEKGMPGSKTSGGIVTACCPHGICQGFHVLVNCEGRNDVFTVLIERYEVPPLLVAYDFGCALREYCLNRCPEMFALTLFKIDRYHEFNHSASVCSKASHLSMHKDLEWMNSQACEQLNSYLKDCMKGRTELYNKTNYLNTVRLWIRSWNARKIQGLKASNA